MDETMHDTPRHPGTASRNPQGRANRLAWKLFAFCLIVFWNGEGVAETVSIVSSGSGGLYTEFVNSFRTRLQQSDTAGKINVDVIVLGNSLLDPSRLEGSNLILAVGSQATAQLSNTKIPAPVLSVLIPRPTFEEIARQPDATKALSAIYLDQPLARQLRLITIVLPETRNLGTVLGPFTARQQDELAREAQALGIDVKIAHVAPVEPDPARALTEIMPGSSAVLALPDPAVFNRYTIRPFLLATFRAGVPVFGFSAAFVTAGAVAAVYSSPSQLGTQAAELAYSYLTAGDDGWLKQPRFPKYFHVSTNRSVAESLHITLPEDTVIEQRLRAAEAQQ